MGTPCVLWSHPDTARGISRPTDGQWWGQAVIHTNQGPNNSQGYLNGQGIKKVRRRLPLPPCTWSWISLTDLGWEWTEIQFLPRGRNGLKMLSSNMEK